MNASWRDTSRHAIVEATVAVVIDANGQGTAYLPPAFLDAVFAEASTRYMATQDVAVWFNRPGLYLNFYSDDGGYSHYCFRDFISGWNFGGSLSDLVDQLGLSWWPGLPPLQGVEVMVNLGNPLAPTSTVNCELEPTPESTLTPTSTPETTLVPVGAHGPSG
jgi:hypothetical protein